MKTDPWNGVYVGRLFYCAHLFGLGGLDNSLMFLVVVYVI